MVVAVQVLVVLGQVVVMVGQFMAQRQQTRLAFLDKRVALHEATTAVARCPAEINDDEDIYGRDSAIGHFNSVAGHFRDLYPA